MNRIIMHIDVNSAYLSWSAIKLLQEGYGKDIRKEVSVIAGDPTKRHGVVVAASIPAKKVGIKPPINLYEAQRIYPNVIVTKPDFTFYKEMSNKLIAFLKMVFPSVEQFSIDECFVNYGEVKEKYGDEVNFAYRLKNEIFKRFGFTVNVGIGNNKLCAKMASDFSKPNKVHTLYQNEFEEKMWPKDVSELFMAGKASCQKLRELGINTIGELANYDELKLISILKSHGKLLYDYAHGKDDSEIKTDSYNERKSISYSRTLETSSDSRNLLNEYLKDFSIRISNELNKRHFYAKTVILILRNDSFDTVSRQIKLDNATNSEETIFENGQRLLNKLWDGDPIRLIGLGVGDFRESLMYQLSLFE